MGYYQHCVCLTRIKQNCVSDNLRHGDILMASVNYYCTIIVTSMLNTAYCLPEGLLVDQSNHNQVSFWCSDIVDPRFRDYKMRLGKFAEE